MMQAASVPRLGGPDAMIPDKEAVQGADVGAIRTNDFPRQANESGRAGGDHASLRTDPDDAERDTGICGQKAGVRVPPSAPMSSQVSPGLQRQGWSDG
jgi:hypothetical protein